MAELTGKDFWGRIYADAMRPVADRIDELYHLPTAAATMRCQA